VLAVADASTFHKSYGDQAGALWSPSGRLLATTTQMMYFKA
jgi:acyl-CoA thioesterase